MFDELADGDIFTGSLRRSLRVDHLVTTDIHAPAGQDFFQAGFPVNGPMPEERHQAAAAAEILINLSQLRVRQGDSGAGDDQEAAIAGGRRGVGVKQRDGLGRDVVLRQEGRQLEVAVVLILTVHRVFPMTAQEAGPQRLGAGNREQGPGEEPLTQELGGLAAVFGVGFVGNLFQDVFRQGVAWHEPGLSFAIEDDEVLVAGGAELVLGTDLLGRACVAQVIYGLDRDLRIDRLVLIQEVGSGGVELIFFVVIEDDPYPIGEGMKKIHRQRRQFDFCPSAPVETDGEKEAAGVIDHHHDRKNEDQNEADLQAKAPLAIRGETGFESWFSRHSIRYFQRRLSTIRKVRNRKKNVRLTKSTTGWVSTIPLVKSCIWRARAKQANTCACQVSWVWVCSARTLSRKRLTLRTKVRMAATIWLRVKEEAQQPREMKRPPSNRMPRNVPPRLPGLLRFLFDPQPN